MFLSKDVPGDERPKEFPDGHRALLVDGALLIRDAQDRNVVAYGPNAWLEASGDVSVAIA